MKVILFKCKCTFIILLFSDFWIDQSFECFTISTVQVAEDTDSGSNPESLSDAVNSLSNEVVAAILLLAEQVLNNYQTFLGLYSLGLSC